jgi:hypothetical protein
MDGMFLIMHAARLSATEKVPLTWKERLDESLVLLNSKALFR